MVVPLDPEPVLAQLKDFQRKTVEYVFRRMYTDADYAARFLVADEVGLGKTLVARGLIAKAISHLQAKGYERVDIVYVCSNANIAQQNVNRLRVPGLQEFNAPTRITLLPMQLHALRPDGINFVSLTPGTSFDLKSQGGLVSERALIYYLLSEVWGWRRDRHRGVFELLRGGASEGRFRDWVDWIRSPQVRIDPSFAEGFRRELERDEAHSQSAGVPGLHERFETLAEKYRRTDSWLDWRPVVGDLRQALARSCVHALEPELIILDEFQRFRNLLQGDDPAAELAGFLFDEPGARVLLLSATPYKMYTLPEESDALEDHYADFLKTTEFLIDDAAESARFGSDLRAFRESLLDLESAKLEDIRARRDQVEKRLRRVMCRTERLAVTPDRNGMLTELPSSGLRLEHSDVRAYVIAERVRQRLRTPETLEYWKSAPYLLNFMESYKLKVSFRNAVTDPSVETELASMLSGGDGLLPFQALNDYDAVDPGNARLRALMDDTIDNQMWQLLWLPPSLDYYQSGVPFSTVRSGQVTKRLVFSAWSVVPHAISTLVSYEAERRMVRSGKRELRNTPEARRSLRPLLRVQRQGERIAGLPLVALVYPSPGLARLGDPLQLAAELDGASAPPTLEAVARLAEQRVAAVLPSIVGGSAVRSGPVDERWYWVAPLLLDAAEAGSAAGENWVDLAQRADFWLADEMPASTEPPDEARTSKGSTFIEVVALARETVTQRGALGRPPDDLTSVLARVALAAPGVCSLRALARAAGGMQYVSDPHLRAGALRAAWGFRSLFNVPEVTAMLRSPSDGDDDAYWRKVLDYCLNGNLQAVLDEYAHVLCEWLPVANPDPIAIGARLGQAIQEALTVRAANYGVEDIQIQAPDHLAVKPTNLRARYALRFGTQIAEESGDIQRAGAVRHGFNSPFWPFILSTTSVGQEGLDFHLYCHAVVHWNLPANPVDLEQREGRVHRYKGHAVRKNVAGAHRAAAFGTRGADPWQALFAAACEARDPRDGDLVPYWVYPIEGGARIERRVPVLPLSREIEKLEQLKRSLAVYRLAFGQPRQDDLTVYLDKLPEDRRLAVAGELRIDLSPP